VVVDGKIVSQLCDEDGNMTELEFKEAMRKQVLQKLAIDGNLNHDGTLRVSHALSLLITRKPGAHTIGTA
jgi:hypothetical protein